MITPSRHSIAVALNAARIRARVSPARLAHLMGISVAIVHGWMKADPCPATVNVIKICDALGVPVEEVVQAARDEEEKRCRRAGRRVLI